MMKSNNNIKKIEVMKIAGIVFLVFAVLNLFVAIAASAHGATDAAGQKFSGVIMFTVIGGFLLYLGNKKEEEKKEHDKWKNGEQK